MKIRPFCNGDETALHAVFHSSVHGLACKDYTPAQLAAWAPHLYDATQWGERMQRNQPFIAELDGGIAGFADLQDGGYIDQFFVAGNYAGRGVANALMAHIEQLAARRGMAELRANVSLTAEPFFSKNGFAVEARQLVEVRGVVLANARMCKKLSDRQGSI